MQDNTLDALIQERIFVKGEEDKLAERRRGIDAKIVLLCGEHNAEGTVTKKTEGHKVSVTFGITRKVDTENLRLGWDALTPAAQAAFRWKAEAAVPQLRALSPENLTAVAKFIESKPASPSIKIEAL
jgi:hypothetical protein